MLPDSTPVTQALDNLGISYRFFRHSGPVTTLEQAAEERGMHPDQVVRSIVFRTGPGDFVMVLVSGRRQIPWPAIRQHLGRSHMTMATEEEVLQATGYQRGAVSPFGLPAPMPVLIDRSVLAQEIISLGAGVRSTAVILAVEDLLKALPEGQMVNLTGE